MAQENLFNAFKYFESIGRQNKLAKENDFYVGFCSGPEGMEDAVRSFRKEKNFILVDDTTAQHTFSQGTGFFRTDVYTVFIVAAYRIDDMQDREEKLNLCRRIFRQIHSRLIYDKENMAYGDSLEYMNVGEVYSTEMPRYALNGVTGLYFMVQNEEPIDISYDANEWTADN